ncbi:MAG: hypothetical protein HRT71_04985 [Flavobacteriales bacterium]|nr:hypothetical protein [Flavobacteriales bacterium]
MNKSKQKEFLKKLAAYSIVATSSLVASLEVKADYGCFGMDKAFDPEVTITVYGTNTFDLDLNDDGKTDFVFAWRESNGYLLTTTYTNTVLKVYGYSSSGIRNYNNVLLGNSSGVNDIFPYRSGLNEDASWVNPTSHDTFIASMSDFMAYPKGENKWINSDSSGRENGIFGFKFEIDGNIHYGWAQATLQTHKDGWPSLTFHRYGYSYTPNEAMVPYPLCVGIESKAVKHHTVYSFGNTIYLNGNSGAVEVYNVTGQLIYSGSDDNVIELKGHSGTHVVRQKGVSTKVYLN